MLRALRPPLALTEEAYWGSSILISPLAQPIPGPWQLFAFLSCSLTFPWNSNRANGENAWTTALVLPNKCVSRFFKQSPQMKSDF